MIAELTATTEELQRLYEDQPFRKRCSCGVIALTHRRCQFCDILLGKTHTAESERPGICVFCAHPIHRGDATSLAIAMLKWAKDDLDWDWLQSEEASFWCDVAGVDPPWFRSQLERHSMIRRPKDATL